MMNLNPVLTGAPPTTERKRKHKLTEQRGRQKINSQINDLKNLLPECKYVITTKASILECAVNSLKRLQTLCNQLMYSNKKLQKENRRLRAELDRLRESGVMVYPINSEDEDDEPEPALTPGETSPSNASAGGAAGNNLTSLQLSSLPPVPGMSPVEAAALSNAPVDPFLVDYCSSPNVPSPSSSSPNNSSPPFSPLSPIDPDSFTNFEEANNGNNVAYNDFDPQNFTRFTKRRLLLVFLFMIPFFLNLDSFYPSSSSSSADSANFRSRVLYHLSMDDSQAQHYFDFARLVWYVVGGTLGVTWTVNTFLWANQLCEGEVKPLKKKVSTREEANFLTKGATQKLRRKIVL